MASLAREEGWLVVRFGAGLSRATAMQLLSPSFGAPLPGVRAGDMTFASNQVRIRLPKDALKGWVADAGGGVAAGGRGGCGGGAGRVR